MLLCIHISPCSPTFSHEIVVLQRIFSPPNDDARAHAAFASFLGGESFRAHYL